MLDEVIIYNIIGVLVNGHNRKEQEKFRQMFPKSNYKSTPKMKPIENKPFSDHLEEAINKIK